MVIETKAKGNPITHVWANKVKDALYALDGVRTIPLVWNNTGCTVTYDGEYIKMVTSGASEGIGTAFSMQRLITLYTAATIRCETTDKMLYLFFYEPQKSAYSNFQGFESDATKYYVKSRKAAAETSTELSNQDWTVEHEYAIRHEYDETDCMFYVAGALVATHSTNVSSQPYQCLCCEDKGSTRTFYLKYPPGIHSENT